MNKIKLKYQYAFSLIGLVLIGWGGGILSVTYILEFNPINMINATGLLLLGVGLAISIKTLSTIKKLDIEVE